MGCCDHPMLSIGRPISATSNKDVEFSIIKSLIRYYVYPGKFLSPSQAIKDDIQANTTNRLSRLPRFHHSIFDDYDMFLRCNVMMEITNYGTHGGLSSQIYRPIKFLLQIARSTFVRLYAVPKCFV